MSPVTAVCLIGIGAIIAAFKTNAAVLNGEGAFNLGCLALVLVVVAIFNAGRSTR